jgi:hypothetical protein
MHTMRFVAIAFVWACRRKSSALIAFTVTQLIMMVTGGSSLHRKDLALPFRVLQLLSPLRWAHSSLLSWEFGGTSGGRFSCSNNPIIQQENAILIKADCGLESRDHVLKWFDITTHPLSHDLIYFAVASSTFLILGAVSFCCCARTKHGGWNRKLKSFH